MANEKISAMPAASALTGSELLAAVQGGVNVRTTVAAAAALASGVGGSVLLGSYDLTGLASQDVVDLIDNTYDDYAIVLSGIRLTQPGSGTNTASLWILTSADNGNTFDSGAGNYAYDYFGVNGSDQVSAARIQFQALTSGNSGTVQAGMSGTLLLVNPCANTTDYKAVVGQTYGDNFNPGSFGNFYTINARRKASAIVNALRFKTSSGVTFKSGSVQIYGLRSTISSVTPASTGRELLTADRTYYVDTAGDNANDGLTALTPFLTIQHAINVISKTLDLQGFNVTVSCAAGTYVEDLSVLAVTGAAIGYTGSDTPAVVIQGIAGNHDSVVIQRAVYAPVNAECIPPGQWGFKNLQLDTTGGAVVQEDVVACVKMFRSALDFDGVNYKIFNLYVCAFNIKTSSDLSVRNAAVIYGTNISCFVQALNNCFTTLKGSLAIANALVIYNSFIAGEMSCSFTYNKTPAAGPGTVTGYTYYLIRDSALNLATNIPGTNVGSADASSSVDGVPGP
jgi:hypothetical protein